MLQNPWETAFRIVENSVDQNLNTGQMLWIQDKCCGSDMQRKLTTMIRGAVTETDAVKIY